MNEKKKEQCPFEMELRISPSAKSYHQSMIEDFMKNAGQEVPSTPTIPDGKVRELRVRLIMEEALETVAALGFCIAGPISGTSGFTACPIPNKELSLEEIADGCCDLSIVTIGTLSACGMKDLALMEEVDLNNMDKIKGGKVNEYGKLEKPKAHKPPNLNEIITVQAQGEGELEDE